MIHWLIQSLDDCPEILRDDLTPVWLGEAEQQRLATFKVEKRRRDWLLGRWTAKNLVRVIWPRSRVRHWTWHEIVIGADAEGAPFAM